MTVNSSMGCGGAPASPGPSDTAVAGTPVAEPEAAGSSLFSMMLSGMAGAPVAAQELPALVAVPDSKVPASSDEVKDPVLLDPALLSSDAAAQAMVATLVPVAVAAPANQLKQSSPAESLATVSPGAARQAESPAPANEGLAAAWLVAATRVAPVDAEGDAIGEATGGAVLQDGLVDGASPDHLVAGSQIASATAAVGSPSPGFSPMMQVSQLGSAFAPFTADTLQSQPPLQHNVGTARWAEELGTRLTLMASQGQLSGSLSLSPEHLGPLHVQIDIKNDVASVWFGSQHADTRAALNDALPRLREMFGASGLVLGDTGVSRDTPRQGAHVAEVRRFSGQREDPVVTSTQGRTARLAHTGTIDTYA